MSHITLAQGAELAKRKPSDAAADRARGLRHCRPSYNGNGGSGSPETDDDGRTRKTTW